MRKWIFSLCIAISFVELHSNADSLWENPEKLKFNSSTRFVRPTPAKRGDVVTFEYPVEYNRRVQFWISYFQNDGKKVFQNWLSRSKKYMPAIKRILKQERLPTDLAYIAMIESGLVPHAVSPANAVGPWQFINETGKRFGLKTNWWLDERRDIEKSTRAAAKYLKELYSMFNCWNLAAAGYNAGENKIARLVEKHQTKSFWKLAKYGAIPSETQNYIPKLMATLLIAKAPALYGFREINYQEPLEYDFYNVPGGTRLDYLSSQIGWPRQTLRELNPELIRGYVPFSVSSRRIRIPIDTKALVARAIRLQMISQIEHSNHTIGKN